MFLPVRQRLQIIFQTADFLLVLVAVQRAAHQAETQVHQISIGRIGFTVVADFFQTAFMKRLPDFTAVHTQFSGEAAQLGHIVQRHIGTGLVEGEQVHQVAMAVVITADVIIPFKIAAVAEIALAHVPITGGRDAVYQGTVVQHGQVETAAVPTHQLRRVRFDQLKKTRNHRFLVIADFAYRADVDFVLPPTHTAGYGHHLLQMVLHKIAACPRTAFLTGEFHHLRIRHFRR